MVTKVLVGLTLAVVFGAIVWFAPAWVLSLLVVVVCALAAVEMMELIGSRSGAFWAAFFASLVPLSVWFLNTWGLSMGLAFALSLVGIKAVLSRKESGAIADEIKATITTVIFCGFFSAMWIPVIKFSRAGEVNWIFWMFAGVYLNDTGAYFGGKLFGKHQLSKLSPNKTVEGLIAGSLVSAVYFLVLGRMTALGAWLGLLLGLSVAVLAPTGDLFESALKRAAGKKDSGALFPGHGGILDRTDSVLFSAPAVLIVYYVGLVF